VKLSRSLLAGITGVWLTLGASAGAQEAAFSLAGHRDIAFALAFSADGKLVASGGHDGAINVSEVATGKRVLALRARTQVVYVLEFSPDGKLLAAGCGDPGRVHTKITFSGMERTETPPKGEYQVWDLATAKEVKSAQFPGEVVRSVGFLNNGGDFFTMASDGACDRRDFKSGKSLENFTKRLHSDGRVSLSRDGNLLLWTDKLDSLRIFDKTSGKECSCKHAGQIVSIAATRDGKLAASGTTVVKLWRTATGKEEGEIKGFKAGVFALAFSPDGKILATGSGEHRFGRFVAGEIKLWSVAAKAELAAISAHMDSITCLAFSPDGRFMASASCDGSVKLWRITCADK
jgi:WD40 repeat protein